MGAEVVALVPFRNEEENLRTLFRGLEGVVDQVVGLDDGSVDDSARVFEGLGGRLAAHAAATRWADGGEAHARSVLLDAGREAGGTHFLWIDADEIPSERLRPKLRGYICDLSPGETLELLWVNAWQDAHHYRRRTLLGDPGYRSFAHADSPEALHVGAGLHFQKVPQTAAGRKIRVPSREGAIVHLQFCHWSRARAKQAWYQIVEMNEGQRSSLQISLRYRDTDQARPWSVRRLPPEWRLGQQFHELLSSVDDGGSTGRAELIHECLALIESRGMKTFEPLRIWDVAELFECFEREEGRSPAPRFIPLPVLYAADLVERLGLVRVSRSAFNLARQIRGLLLGRDSASRWTATHRGDRLSDSQ